METLTCKGMWTGPAESQFQPFQNDEEEQSHLDYFGKLFIYYVVKRNIALSLNGHFCILHFFTINHDKIQHLTPILVTTEANLFRSSRTV